VKYTEKGFVRVKVEEKGSDVFLSVADSGMGIPKAMLKTIFDEFIRDPRMKTLEGAGIGLAITKTFVEAHDGKTWAESGGEGKGATFFISVPKK